jgi:acyl-CoA synthetase (AMP-forming)/AMP-acid ligase II
LIITYGRNFYPHDIEWLAADVEGVRTGCVAAFGIPNTETSTEEIVIIAETRETDAESLKRIRRDMRKLLITTIECNPKHIVLVAPRAVPKTTSGKIRRVEARRLFLDNGFDRLL